MLQENNVSKFLKTAYMLCRYININSNSKNYIIT